MSPHDNEANEASPAASEKAKPGDSKSPAEKPEEPLLSIDDFFKIDLRIARILEVEPHPNADRLLRLQIDLGTERRQIVAGLAEHYQPDDLIGREVVVVANLKPAKLRGELSQGMLLAASDDSGVALVSPIAAIAPGSKVG